MRKKLFNIIMILGAMNLISIAPAPATSIETIVERGIYGAIALVMIWFALDER